jgi:transposase
MPARRSPTSISSAIEEVAGCRLRTKRKRFPTGTQFEHRIRVTDSPTFAPVPVRARVDGWTPRRQRIFMELLRRGRSPAHAARRVGMTKQTAYALRRRPRAESFAAAWDAAVAGASRERIERVRRERGPGLAERAWQGYWTPHTYRGRVTSWTHRYDNRAAMRILNNIDRFVERHPGIEERTWDVDIDAEMERLLPGSSWLLDEIAPFPPELGQFPPHMKAPPGEIRREPGQLGQFPLGAAYPLSALWPTPGPLPDGPRPAAGKGSP